MLTSTATLGGQTSEFGGNVTVTSGPTLTHLKSVAVLSDPLNNTTNPKSIPGAMQVYTLRITNQGTGSVDNNTVAIVDAVPANTALFVQDLGAAGSGPVAFTNGTPTSALTYTFSGLGNAGDDLEFSNNGGTTLGLHAGGERQRLRSGRDAYKSAPERHDGRRERRGQSVLRGQVPGASELESGELRSVGLESGFAASASRPTHWV